MANKNVLIIGEDPALIDFDAPDAPKDMSAEKVMAGLNGSVTRLQSAEHDAELLLTRNADSIEAQVRDALQGKNFDVIVVGTGLRTLPLMAEQFERLMNVLSDRSPQSKLAFNSLPHDSDTAALRWL